MVSKQIHSEYRSLKAWRAAMGFTQQDCARLLGVSQPQYCRWESGHLRPKPKVAAVIARKTGVPILDLLGVAA